MTVQFTYLFLQTEPDYGTVTQYNTLIIALHILGVFVKIITLSNYADYTMGFNRKLGPLNVLLIPG